MDVNQENNVRIIINYNVQKIPKINWVFFVLGIIKWVNVKLKHVR